MTIAIETELVRFASRTLRRVEGQRLAIGTDRSDMLTVTAQPDATTASLTRFIGAHYAAIYRWVQRGSACDAWAPIAKELVPGEGFDLAAYPHRLRWDAAEGLGATFIHSGRWLLVHPDLRGDSEGTRDAIIKCYGQHARDRVRAAAEELGPRFGVTQLLTVRSSDRDQTWVSMRAGKAALTIEAHWALAQFSATTIRYLVARTFAARPGVRSRLDVVMPCPEQPRRRMHAEAPGVWTGEIA